MYVLTDMTTQTIKYTESRKLTAFLKLIYPSKYNQISSIFLGNLDRYVLNTLDIVSFPYNDVLTI